MSILLTIFLLSFPGDPDETSKQDITTLVDEIATGEASSIEFWSLAQYLGDVEWASESAESAAEKHPHPLSDLLSADKTTEQVIEDLAVYYEDEHLHLYLQLAHLELEERPGHFEDFYSSHDQDKLRGLTRSIAHNNNPDRDFLDREGWDFALFLLLLRSHHIDVDDDFYETILERLEGAREEADELSPLEREFFHLSVFIAQYNLDRFSSIVDDAEQYLNLTHFPKTSVLRNLFRLLDYALYSTGQIDLSLEVQRQFTIPLSEQLGDRQGLIEILANHGGYLYTIGRFHEARAVFETALEDEEHLSSVIRTRLLNNLSLVYYKMGEQSLYIETQMQALSLANEQDNLSYQLRIYRNLHIYYRQNQNWDLAQQYIDHARRIAEEAGDREELGSIIISQAVFHDHYLNMRDEALSLLHEADELLDDSAGYRLRVRLLTELGDLYSESGEYETSLDFYRQVLDIGAENRNDFMYLAALIDLADTELRLDNLEEAEKHIREFNAHDVTIVDFPALVDARRIEADIAFRQGDLRRAERLIDLVYPQMLERARNTTDIEGGYWRVEQSYLRLFQLYADLLIHQDRGEKLVSVLDQLKTINDAALFENPLIQAEHLSEEELSENRRIQQQLDDLRKQYLTADEERRLDLRNRIATLNARKNRLTREQGPDQVQSLDRLWALRSQLRNGEMILHATRILDRFYLVTIDRNRIEFRQIAMDEAAEEMFRDAIYSLQNGDTDLNRLHEVYRWLELDRLPSRLRSLIVVPDSYLYHLPLSVLPVQEPEHNRSYGSARYLIEELDVRYLNSLKDLNRRTARRSYEYDYSGFGLSDFGHHEGELLVPLPGAPREVERIASNLNPDTSVRTFIESEGTPLQFRNSASDSRILHLASHSKVDNNDPLFSRIYLASPETPGAWNPNGQVFAYQLFDMELDNELIMFNSCESGSGEALQGAGVMGLSRALRYAGARSQVLNSWMVHDQFASEFAVQFYDNLGRGNRKAEALRSAKIHMLNHSNANPHYWGAYILSGDNRPLFRQESDLPVTVTLSVLLIAGIVFTRRRLSTTRLPS